MNMMMMMMMMIDTTVQIICTRINFMVTPCIKQC